MMNDERASLLILNSCKQYGRVEMRILIEISNINNKYKLQKFLLGKNWSFFLALEDLVSFNVCPTIYFARLASFLCPSSPLN